MSVYRHSFNKKYFFSHFHLTFPQMDMWNKENVLPAVSALSAENKIIHHRKSLSRLCCCVPKIIGSASFASPPVQTNMVVHIDNENAMVLDWIKERTLSNSGSHTQKVFFLDVVLGWGSIVVRKQEKGRTESVYKAARIIGVALRNQVDARQQTFRMCKTKEKDYQRNS